jgi:hypothetical protein
MPTLIRLSLIAIVISQIVSCSDGVSQQRQDDSQAEKLVRTPIDVWKSSNVAAERIRLLLPLGNSTANVMQPMFPQRAVEL